MTTVCTLEATVASWCAQRRIKVLRDDHTATGLVLPPLLAQLEGAVGSGSTRHARRSSGGRCPANLDAIDLLGRLHVQLAVWEARLAAGVEGPRHPGGWLWRPQPTLARIRRLPHLPWDDGDDVRAARILNRLADAARILLTPPDIPVWRWIRNTACPRCLYRVLVEEDDERQPVRVPTLLIGFDGTGRVDAITCAACWAGWWRNQVPDLWDELEAIRPTLAEVDGGRELRSGRAGQGGAWLADMPVEMPA